MIIPANEALKMQANKQKTYMQTEFEERLKYIEKRFNYDLNHCHRSAEYVEIDGYYSYEEDGRPNGNNKKPEREELLELVKRVKNSGYYVEKEQYSNTYRAYFKKELTWMERLFK